MNCPKCGREISRRRKRCEICGQDVGMYERLVYISNSYYNKGLERARVRDLSGAIDMLKKSLEINKENTNARNLLGLVYFEMGEAVAALSEWVISQNFQPLDNDAEYFLKKVQSDTVAFDGMNQTIKKFNIALINAKRQDDDLAILQLKRVISQNPKFVRALLLLALVYMKNCEYEKARRCLVRVQKIDVANVTALRYLEEIRLNTQQGGQASQEGNKEFEESSFSSQIVPITSYREDKPNFIAFITFFLGILIGVAVIYYMAVPNIRQSIKEEYNKKERNYSAVVSAKDVKISELESDIRILEAQIEDLERIIRREEGYTLIDYEPFIDLMYAYQAYLKQEAATVEQTEKLLQDAKNLDMTDMTDLSAVALHEDMIEVLEGKAGEAYFAEGLLWFGNNMEEARPLLEMAFSYTPDNPELVYHLARVYHELGELFLAKDFYEMVLEKYQYSSRCQEAEIYLGYVEEAIKNVTPTPAVAE